MSVASISASDPLSTVDYAALIKRHPEGQMWQGKWSDYRLLYKGGEEFLLAAGQEAQTRASNFSETLRFDRLQRQRRRRRFLHQLEGEPDTVYISRWERAVFVGYVGPIIDYFRHWAFSEQPVIRPVDDVDPPDWWEAFAKDVDGKGTDFLAFVRDVFGDVLQVRRAGWLISTPGSTEYSENDRATLCPYTAEGMYDWQENPPVLNWWTLRKCEHIREFPAPRMQYELFTYVDTDRWRVWQTEEDGGQKQLRIIGDGHHGLGEPPFVPLVIPEGLWPLNKLASWQIDLFNKYSMLSRGQLLSCFAQPFIRSNDPTAESRIFGEDFLLRLNAGMGDNPGEEFGWKTLDSIEPLKFTAEQLKEQRDEGYRIVHQMSLAVDSQAVGAIARSGASKIEDRKATEIILGAYGSYIREAIVKTCNLLSKIYGDNLKWECRGFDSFNVSSLDEELAMAALIDTLRIPSPTFKKETLVNLATGRILGHAAQSTRDLIKHEITEAIDREQQSQEDMGTLTASGKSEGDAGEKFFQYEIEGGVVTLNEVRASKGLGPIEDGDLTLPQYRAKHPQDFAVSSALSSSETAAEVAADQLGLDPAQFQPKPAFGGFGNRFAPPPSADKPTLPKPPLPKAKKKE